MDGSDGGGLGVFGDIGGLHNCSPVEHEPIKDYQGIFQQGFKNMNLGSLNDSSSVQSSLIIPSISVSALSSSSSLSSILLNGKEIIREFELQVVLVQPSLIII